LAGRLPPGCGPAGLPVEVRDTFAPAQRVRLPMRPDQRSLNLSKAVAVAVFDAWRGNGYVGSVT
jgi:tRNA (cytidine/uridine-2'-O-)-methyltransferase